MKTIITKDLSSTQTPAPWKQLQVAPDGESFVYVDAGINQIVAGSNISVSRVGNSVTVASTWGGGGGGFWVDPDANNLISVNDGFLFADKRSSAHTYNNTSSGIVSTNVQWAIDELSSHIANTESAITSINTNITNINAINTTQTSDITSINTNITNINSDIASINTINTTQTSDIAAINTNLGLITANITAIESVNTTQTSDITTINTNITSINSSITTINSNITTLNSRMPTPAGVLLVDGWQTPINTTTHTLTLADYNTTIVHTNASASTITVPPNSSVAFPINTQIDIVQNGAGKVTLAQWAGVTINSKWWNKSLAAQYTWATLKKVWTDTWILFGELIV